MHHDFLAFHTAKKHSVRRHHSEWAAMGRIALTGIEKPLEHVVTRDYDAVRGNAEAGTDNAKWPLRYDVFESCN